MSMNESLYLKPGALDSTALRTQAALLHDGVKIEETVCIAREPNELFSFWRQFSNLPRIMKHLRFVEELSPTQSRWHWRSVSGFETDWTAELIAEIQDHMISWQTLPETEGISHAGSVWFRPMAAGDLTEVRVQLMYRIEEARQDETPLGHEMTELLGDDPSRVLHDDLRRFKLLMERT